jgi:hypothetical protein
MKEYKTIEEFCNDNTDDDNLYIPKSAINLQELVWKARHHFEVDFTKIIVESWNIKFKCHNFNDYDQEDYSEVFHLFIQKQ